jgi:2'-5' RNA ligase
MLRLFFAVEIPAASRSALGALVDSLAPRLRGVKWVDPANLHVTLKFLGNTPDAQVPLVIRAAQRIASSVEPFELDLAGFGAFPSAGRPRILWAALQGPVERLAAMAAQLEADLAPLGFARETRPFSGHVTLGRARQGQRIPPVEEQVRKLAAAAFGRLPVRRLVLFQSTLTPSGPIYETLAYAPLSGAEP